MELNYLSDLPRAGWCSKLCLEGLWMIKLMVLGFCPIGADASPGRGRRIYEENCLAQLQGSKMSPV